MTFKLVGSKKITDFVTVLRTRCLPIQSGGSPMLGVDPWPNTWVLFNRTAKFQLMRTPACYWNDVTNHYEISNRKHRNGTITRHAPERVRVPGAEVSDRHVRDLQLLGRSEIPGKAR